MVALWRRKVLVALAVVIGCTHADPTTERVVVRDSNFEIIRTIDAPASLTQFTEIWQTRRRVDAGPRDLSAYPFKLDISARKGSGRWLYRPDGFTTILSVKSGANTYAIPGADLFNDLLGLPPIRPAAGEHRE